MSIAHMSMRLTISLMSAPPREVPCAAARSVAPEQRLKAARQRGRACRKRRARSASCQPAPAGNSPGRGELSYPPLMPALPAPCSRNRGRTEHVRVWTRIARTGGARRRAGPAPGECRPAAGYPRRPCASAPPACAAGRKSPCSRTCMPGLQGITLPCSGALPTPPSASSLGTQTVQARLPQPKQACEPLLCGSGLTAQADVPAGPPSPPASPARGTGGPAARRGGPAARRAGRRT